ncbi:MAG: hypothetical protein ACR2IR_08150 [Acidimicrobiia bacterium]
MTIAITVLVVVLTAALTAGFVLLRQVRRRAQEDLEARVGSDNIGLFERSANCLGHSDADVDQSRGAGALALCADGIHFMGWIPRGRYLHIPAGAIESATATRAYTRPGFARASARPMLQVDYRTRGRAARVAWSVTDADVWSEAIGELRRAS